MNSHKTPTSKMHRAGSSLPQAIINHKEFLAKCRQFFNEPAKDGSPRPKIGFNGRVK
jgi:hypothetical protein